MSWFLAGYSGGLIAFATHLLEKEKPAVNFQQLQYFYESFLLDCDYLLMDGIDFAYAYTDWLRDNLIQVWFQRRCRIADGLRQL